MTATIWEQKFYGSLRSEYSFEWCFSNERGQEEKIKNLTQFKFQAISFLFKPGQTEILFKYFLLSLQSYKARVIQLKKQTIIKRNTPLLDRTNFQMEYIF